jgi:hypothetical protein
MANINKSINHIGYYSNLNDLLLVPLKAPQLQGGAKTFTFFVT